MQSEYTLKRKIYANIGFVTVGIAVIYVSYLAVKGVKLLVWAHKFIAANGY